MSTTAKNTHRSEWNDQRIELLMGRLLRAGVLLSAAVVILGGMVYLVRHGHAVVSYRDFRGGSSPLRSVSGIFRGLARFSGSAIIQLGLLLLIATPVARVVFSAVAFLRERDYLYVALTLTVLAVLCYSLFGAAGH
jgi:uncharacterized membrane protein